MYLIHTYQKKKNNDEELNQERSQLPHPVIAFLHSTNTYICIFGVFFIMFVIYLCSFLSLFGRFLQVKDTINAATVVHPASALVQ